LGPEHHVFHFESKEQILTELTSGAVQERPYIPGSSWQIHDLGRPQPPVVTPGTESTPQAPGRAPSDAVVLFGGRDLAQWESAANGGPAPWKVERGYMEVMPRSGDIRTRVELGDCQLHVEWAAPEEVAGESQGRGNSGIFLFGKEHRKGYELQVLDGYENPTYADGAAAALYGQYPPLVNACRRPGEWQTYDIVWIAPRFDGERLVSPGYVTLLHNGVLVHHHREVLGQTALAPPVYEPHPPTGPLRLQDHRNPVRYRNIWFRPLSDLDAR
jgi:hypothetical protein